MLRQGSRSREVLRDFSTECGRLRSPCWWWHHDACLGIDDVPHDFISCLPIASDLLSCGGQDFVLLASHDLRSCYLGVRGRGRCGLRGVEFGTERVGLRAGLVRGLDRPEGFRPCPGYFLPQLIGFSPEGFRLRFYACF